MDLVLVGLPGTGKTEVGRRLAERLGATFIDTDQTVQERAGRSIDQIFALDGEAAFRDLDRDVVASLGAAGDDDTIGRVIATGGGTVVDPRNRWHLYGGRRVVWLDASNEVLAGRLSRSPVVRPLLTGGNVEASLETLRKLRARFYAAGTRIDASGPIGVTVDSIIETLAQPAPIVPLLRLEAATGRVILGAGLTAATLDELHRAAGSRRIVILSEPTVMAAAGGAVRAGLEARDWRTEWVELPAGEDAKRLAVIERVAGELARLRVERGEPVVAFGGGALTDAAGFAAATYQRGIPWIAVPTTLLGQLDAALGGKTAVDVAEGKNLVGAFHLPEAVVIDPVWLATLPERQRRAALAEAVKDGVLGDERLLEVLEADGPAVARGDPTAEPSALAEVVERAASVKLAFVEADPAEHGDRIALNLGHTLGHAVEAVAGFGPVLHGEAVAYGLRAAFAIAVELGLASPARASRIERLLDRLGLGVAELPYPVDEVLAVLETDKKRRAGTVRWVLPANAGWTVSSEVPSELVRRVATSVLAGRTAAPLASATP